MIHCSTRLLATLIVGIAAGLLIATYSSTAEFLPELFAGTLTTLQVTSGGIIVAVISALVAAVSKMYGPWPIRWLAVIYIELFRGTSALVQLFWLFLSFPSSVLCWTPSA